MLPYLTTDLPGVGGLIKQRPEDFFVQELPLYEPTGQGEHVYCEIQKTGLTTFDAVTRLAEALHVSSRDIGYAGQKDAAAVTRQIFSIFGTTEPAVMAVKLPNFQVLWAARHGNKLRLGHLRGNRFAVKIRQVVPTDVLKLKAILAVLTARGMPNYFGEQRFGRRANNDQLGAALIRGDAPAALKVLLGSPDPTIDEPDAIEARSLFDQGDLESAMRRYPRRNGLERRILARLVKTSNPVTALRAVDEKLRRLWVSALQSKLFNEALAQRIAGIDEIMAGDLAYKHDNGACFRVTDAAAEQPRCARLEISPTGPLIGYRVSLPELAPLEIETAVFAAAGLAPADFRRAGHHKVKGARRSLRAQPRDIELAAGVDEFGEHITVAFTLPAGSYATVLLRELMKTPDPSISLSQ